MKKTPENEMIRNQKDMIEFVIKQLGLEVYARQFRKMTVAEIEEMLWDQHEYIREVFKEWPILATHTIADMAEILYNTGKQNDRRF